MENLKLPLVLVIALGAQLAGAVFWGANVLRDINDNTSRTDELIEILLETENSLSEVAEIYDEMEQSDEELWDEVDNMVNYFTQLVQLQSRIAILEKTVEFTRRDGM